MRLRAAAVPMVLFWCAITLFSQAAGSQDNGHPRLVSLIRLIASPNNFNDQRIKVIGFLGRGGGLDRTVGLFVSDVDARNFIVPNSIDLHVSESKTKSLIGKYVTLSGVYHAPDPRAGYNGYIDEVVDLKDWSAGDVAK